MEMFWQCLSIAIFGGGGFWLGRRRRRAPRGGQVHPLRRPCGCDGYNGVVCARHQEKN